jgi:hypothetical protein
VLANVTLVLRERLSTRKGKLVMRFIFLVTVAFLFAKIAPTLADENSPAPDFSTPSASASPDPTISAEPTPTPSPSESPSEQPTTTLSPIPSDPGTQEPSPIPTTSSEPTSSASPTPSPTPTVLTLAKQKMVLKVPSKLNADPRANTLYFPSIQISSPEHLLVCISSSNLFLDVYLRGQADSTFANIQLVAGDMSKQVLITGTSQQVAALINGAGGLAVFNPAKPVPGSSVQIQAVAISMPSLNPAFCSQGAPRNVTNTNISPLGITLDFKKGDIPLKR